MFVLAGRPIGAVAATERDLSQAEVIAELVPFLIGGFAVFFAGTAGSSLVDEPAVVRDYLLRIDRDITLSGVQVQVAQYLCGDVDGQAAVDGLGGEHSPEIVRSEPQRTAVDIDDPGSIGEVGQQFARHAWAQDLQLVMSAALKQVRQHRPEDPLVGVVAPDQRHSRAVALDPSNDAGKDRHEFRIGRDDAFPVGLGRADLQQRHHFAGWSLVLAQAQVGELQQLLYPSAGAA
nr:hypothetical protein [Nocardia brevicatena]